MLTSQARKGDSESWWRGSLSAQVLPQARKWTKESGEELSPYRLEYKVLLWLEPRLHVSREQLPQSSPLFQPHIPGRHRENNETIITKLLSWPVCGQRGQGSGSV